LAVPSLPTGFAVVIFTLLVALLVQKEVLRAWERPGPAAWERISNMLIVVLLLVYGLLLLARLASFL
jgi:hypothetical protein